MALGGVTIGAGAAPMPSVAAADQRDAGLDECALQGEHTSTTLAVLGIAAGTLTGVRVAGRLGVRQCGSRRVVDLARGGDALRGLEVLHGLRGGGAEDAVGAAAHLDA